MVRLDFEAEIESQDTMEFYVLYEENHKILDYTVYREDNNAVILDLTEKEKSNVERIIREYEEQ